MNRKLRWLLVAGLLALTGCVYEPVVVQGSTVQQRFDRAWNAAQERKGFVLVTGEVGSGKTLLSRLLLGRLPAGTRTAVITNTRVTGAELLLAWGRPVEGWAVFEPTLGAPSSETATALRRYADLAGGLGTPAGHRVRGLALSRWADLVPSPLAERARAEAVRELLAGDDRAAARLALERLAGDSLAPADAQAADTRSGIIPGRRAAVRKTDQAGDGIGLS